MSMEEEILNGKVRITTENYLFPKLQISAVHGKKRNIKKTQEKFFENELGSSNYKKRQWKIF